MEIVCDQDGLREFLEAVDYPKMGHVSTRQDKTDRGRVMAASTSFGARIQGQDQEHYERAMELWSRWISLRLVDLGLTVWVNRELQSDRDDL